MYEEVNGNGTYQSFEFMFTVDTDNLPSGYNMIIVRGVDADGASSMISWDTVVGGGNVVSMGSGDSLGRTLFIATVTFAVIIFGVWVAIRQSVKMNLFKLAVVSEKNDIPLPKMMRRH